MSSARIAIGQVRKARLERLREDLDPLALGEIRAAIRALLRHPLLRPEGPDPEAYRMARRHHEWMAAWFAHHADWSLSVSAESVRLRKLPASAGDATRGATDPRHEEPFTRRRYVLFCLALAALERSDRQVTLGRLADTIAGGLAADPAFAAAGVMWSLDTVGDRRDFVHAVRLLLALGVLRRVQGDEDRFVGDRETDVLYSVARPILAQLLATRQSPSLIAEPTLQGRLGGLLAEPMTPDTPDARNRALRTWLIRRMLDDPVLYYDELDDEARSYLDRQRGFIIPELQEATGLEAEVRAEGLALVDLEGDCTDLGLPEEGTEGHLIILMAGWLAGKLRRRGEEGESVTLDAARTQTLRLIREHRHHWRREVTERGAEVWMTETVLQNLQGLGLIDRCGDRIVPRAALGRFALRPTAELAGEPVTGDLFQVPPSRARMKPRGGEGLA